MMIQLALGLAIGLVMALTGAGGGILAVPLLVFGAGLSVSQAAPIGLLAVGISAFLGTMLGLRAGIVRYRAALLMAVVGVLMAPIGVWLSKEIAGRWLNGLFALVLLYVAYRTFRQAHGETASKDTQRLACVRREDTGRFLWTTRCARALALSGGVAGLLSGLLGVGGGFVMVPAMKRHTDLPAQSVIATSMAVIALVSISAVVSAILTSSVDWRLAFPFAGGAVGGMLLCRLLSARLAGARLDQGFALLAATVAVGMAVKAIT